MTAAWLHDTSGLAVRVGIISALMIAIDERRYPQRMWIMNLVWPLSGLFGSVFAVWFYFRHGRSRTRAGRAEPSFPIIVAKGTLHCGAGCTLGDVVAEWLCFALPTIAIALGWGTLFSEKIFAVWIADYGFALLFGLAFQYFTIKPMRGLSPAAGLIQAFKADALSLTAWQVGMYGFMAFASLFIFRRLLNMRLLVDSVEFWFMMQIAMAAGFLTAYPVNWWLIRRRIKEAM